MYRSLLVKISCQNKATVLADHCSSALVSERHCQPNNLQEPRVLNKITGLSGAQDANVTTTHHCKSALIEKAELSSFPRSEFLWVECYANKKSGTAKNIFLSRFTNIYSSSSCSQVYTSNSCSHVVASTHRDAGMNENYKVLFFQLELFCYKCGSGAEGAHWISTTTTCLWSNLLSWDTRDWARGKR